MFLEFPTRVEPGCLISKWAHFKAVSLVPMTLLKVPIPASKVASFLAEASPGPLHTGLRLAAALICMPNSGHQLCLSRGPGTSTKLKEARAS